MFSRRAGFLVEKSVKLLILFCLKSKIDKKLYDVIPLSIVVIIKNLKIGKKLERKIGDRRFKNNVLFMFTQKWRKR
jgi:hypothetical protein